jgi:hypothetical protein
VDCNFVSGENGSHFIGVRVRRRGMRLTVDSVEYTDDGGL